MPRIIIAVLVLFLSTWQTVASAPWALPEGVKTLTVNGYPKAYLERGTGETVVLVHGAGNDYRSWAGLTASPPPGFRFVAVSLRHHYPERWDGKGDQYSIRQQADDLAAFIHALGTGPVYLVAHSRGGSVGLKATQARPDLIKKLVLVEGNFQALPGKSEQDGAASRIRELIKSIVARFEQGDIDGGLEVFSDRDRAGTWATRSERDKQRSRDNAWTLIVLERSPVTCADVAGLKMPVLLMQGEKTARRFAEIVEATHKCLPSAERVIIQNAGHAVHVGNPAAFEAELVKFLLK